MGEAFAIPTYITHYYVERPFRTLTELTASERGCVVAGLDFPKEDPRLHSAFYFEQRLQYETVMYEQFRAKGGQPARRRPHYAVLGESEIWMKITKQSLRIPLSAIPAWQMSFTYTDSWPTYVDRDLEGNHIPRKPQYGMLFRVEELDELFRTHGWPGDRWKTESDWEHDLYVEAQIWSDEPLAAYLAANGAA
jgi:hypothetical protein